MKIENDSQSQDAQSTIRRIQDYQEQQVQQQLEQRQADEQAERIQRELATTQGVAEAERSASAGEAGTDPDQGVGAAPDLAAQDVQAQIQAQTIAEVNDAREASGVEKADEAVDLANAQQDRGERWQSFAARDDAGVLPPSVEELAASNDAKDASDQADAQAEAQRKINVQDLLNQMTIQRGRING